MKYLIVDDEPLMGDGLRRELGQIRPHAEIFVYTDPFQAVEKLKETDIDVAFLDIEMPGMNGIELAKRLKAIKPNINFIFCTAYSKYSLEAIKERASGYLLKPVKKEMLTEELNNLRNPVIDDGRIQVVCFGAFEIYVDGKPVSFGIAKSKELLAYLIDQRGAYCSSRDIMTVIWDDDRSHKAYLQNIRVDIKKVLDEIGCSDLVLFDWGKMAINKSIIKCDYYDFLEGVPAAINAYQGEYMKNYSWAEYKNAEFLKQRGLL